MSYMPQLFGAAAAGCHGCGRWRARQRGAVVCLAKQGITSEAAVQELKSALQGGVDPAYVEAAAYLKSVGFSNSADIARVLDVAMNPNSLFVRFNDPKRARNANARPLDVEADMRPAVEFLRSQGLATPQLVSVISAHPPVLSYSVAGRLAPFWAYLSEIGVADVGGVVAKRPSLLGLEVEGSLRKMVEYLQYVETPTETILKYLETSL